MGLVVRLNDDWLNGWLCGLLCAFVVSVGLKVAGLL